MITPSALTITALTPNSITPQPRADLLLNWSIEDTGQAAYPASCVLEDTVYVGTYVGIDTTWTARNHIFAGHQFSFTGEVVFEAGQAVFLVPGLQARGSDKRLSVRIHDCGQGYVPPTVDDFVFDVALWRLDTGQTVFEHSDEGAEVPVAETVLDLGVSYHWRVTATDPTSGTIVAVSEMADVVIATGPAPVVLGLRDGLSDVLVSWSGVTAPVETLVPLLAWAKDSEATAYSVELSSAGLDGQPDWSDPHLRLNLPVDSLLSGAVLDPYLDNPDLFDPAVVGSSTGADAYGTLVEGLARGVTYYWRVRADYATTSSAYSTPLSFTTVPMVLARQYYLRDHLGSIRVTINEASQVIHHDDYYPFGLSMPGRSMVTNAPKERYTGHELDDESGFYYAGARYLDPVMGRWNGVDRLADDYPEWSPYNYAFNNSLRLTDPDGERPCCLPTLVDVRVVASVIGNFFKGANSGLNQRYQTEPSRGATLAGIRDTRAGRISSKTGQPVGEWVVRADKPHGKMTEPHINVNPNATGVPDPHAPISGTTLKALERTGKALDVIGKISKPLAVVADAAQVGGALQQDGGVVGVNTVVATANVAGGWIGAWAGAKGGATLGAGIGSFFPGPGTAIGGFSGGLIGGIGGAFVGSQGAEAVVEEIVEDEDEQ